MIIKFIFTPLFAIDKLEQSLEKAEETGLRLKKINFSCIFYFEQTNPKKATYFVSIKSFKGLSMDSVNVALSSEHSANKIEETFTGFSIYRSTRERDELNFLKDIRLSYIWHYLIERLVCVLIVFLCSLSMLVASKAAVWAIIVCLIVTCITSYYIFSTLVLRRKLIHINKK